MEPLASMVVGAVRRLISMPMNAKGAQQARAQGLLPSVSDWLGEYARGERGDVHSADRD